MYYFTPSSVDHAIQRMVKELLKSGAHTESRNGPVLTMPGPVVTSWSPDISRVSFCPVRNANPFFHYMEAMWMLAGRNDIEFVSQYATVMKQFSDDGGLTQPGAYGHRWRAHFGFDQLRRVIKHLQEKPNSRRAVLAMWDANVDVAGMEVSTDVPCNTHIYFSNRGGQLDMTVCCRSNDAIWGAYGSNIVHFSVLHEVVAAATGLRLGCLVQFSNDMHMYSERPDVLKLVATCEHKVAAGPRVLSDGETLTGIHGFYVKWDLQALREWDTLYIEDIQPWPAEYSPMLSRAVALERAWGFHKAGDTELALSSLRGYHGKTDIILAAIQWLERAQARKLAKEQA
jgi:hypothetical protein